MEQHARTDLYQALRSQWYGDITPQINRKLDSEGYIAATAECELRQLSALAGNAVRDPRIAALQIMPQLSAFRELSEWGETPASDVWMWQREGWLEVEAEVVRAVAHLGVIDPEKLAIEAASLIADRDTLRGHFSFALYRKTEKIDVPPLDWKAARGLDLDLWKIEQALHHGSEYLLKLAVLLLDAVLTDDQRREVIKRVMTEGTGDSFWGAAELAKGLPAAEAISIMLDWLDEHEPTVGAEVLFGVFEHHAAALDHRLERLLNLSLTSPLPRMARAAAGTITALGATAGLRLGLLQAIDHWTTHPAEPPEIGNAVDPRCDMAGALAIGAALLDEELIQLICYHNGEVWKLARERWQDIGNFRDNLLTKTSCGQFSPDDFATIVKSPAPLSETQRAAILGMATNSEPRVRRAVLTVLGWPDFLDAETRPVLMSLAHDTVSDVASAARTILANLT